MKECGGDETPVFQRQLCVFLPGLDQHWQLPTLTWLAMAARGSWTLSVDCGLRQTYQLHSRREVESGGRYDCVLDQTLLFSYFSSRVGCTKTSCDSTSQA